MPKLSFTKSLGTRVLGTAGRASRSAGAFVDERHRKKYLALVTLLIVLAVIVTFALLGYDNRHPTFSEKWWRISNMRVSAIVVIAVVTFCQSFATVTFHTVTNNRIITPSIMGFESLYVLIQTATVFFFSATHLQTLDGYGGFFLRTGVMVVFAVLLYSWLLSGRFGNIHVMLLVGIILGGGMASISTFMQRLLDPNEFDVLTARLFGNISNAETDLLLAVIPICAVAGVLIYLLSRKLNILGLGAEVATNLGLNHRRLQIVSLTLISVLMAMTTSLVGPMTFLGFLIATIAYTLTDTYDHRLIFPVAWLVGYVVLLSAYFVLRHVFYAGGAVTVIVELVGGLFFLFVVLRKGRL